MKIKGRTIGPKADLLGFDLRWADLRWADLQWADLRRADLRWADLRWANLHGAKLHGATLHGATLHGANLLKAKLPPFQIPQEGSLTVYKKLQGGSLAKLFIPASSKRTGSLVGRKCRAKRAKVLSIQSVAGKPLEEGFSLHKPAFMYKVKEYVEAPDYSDDIRIECAPGIHFFLTREEAEQY